MAAQQVVFDGLKAREVVEPYEAAVERFAAGGKASGAEVLDAFRDDVSRVVKAAESAETGEQPENISRKSLEFGVEGGLLKRFPEVLSAPPQFVAQLLRDSTAITSNSVRSLGSSRRFSSSRRFEESSVGIGSYKA